MVNSCLWCKTEYLEPILYKEEQVEACDLDCAHDWKIWEKCLKILFPEDYPQVEPKEKKEEESLIYFNPSPMEYWIWVDKFYISKESIEIKKIMEEI